MIPQRNISLLSNRLTPRDLSNFSGRYISRGERNISKLGLNSSSAKILPKGAVLLSSRAPVGYLAITLNEITTNQGFRSLIPNFKTDSLFLFYLLKKNVEYLKSQSTGTTFGELAGSTLKSLPVLFPPLPEQKAIASVLSSLDDKIDLLHRQNKTLEAMAETLFRQWFVEEAQEDWEEVTLSDCCQVITKGTTPTTLKKAFVPSGINFIKVNCIDKNGNFLADKFQFIDEETNELLGRSKLEEGDILYSIAGTVGRLIIVCREILPANVNQALAIIRVNSIKIYPVSVVSG